MLERTRVLAITAFLALAGCGSTGLAETWVTPSLTAMPHFKKVFVAYIGGDASAQRSAHSVLPTAVGPVRRWSTGSAVTGGV